VRERGWQTSTRADAYRAAQETTKSPLPLRTFDQKVRRSRGTDPLFAKSSVRMSVGLRSDGQSPQPVSAGQRSEYWFAEGRRADVGDHVGAAAVTPAFGTKDVHWNASHYVGNAYAFDCPDSFACSRRHPRTPRVKVAAVRATTLSSFTPLFLPANQRRPTHRRRFTDSLEPRAVSGPLRAALHPGCPRSGSQRTQFHLSRRATSVRPPPR
jgi:hypothetical protein